MEHRDLVLTLVLWPSVKLTSLSSITEYTVADWRPQGNRGSFSYPLELDFAHFCSVAHRGQLMSVEQVIEPHLGPRVMWEKENCPTDAAAQGPRHR